MFISTARVQKDSSMIMPCTGDSGGKEEGDCSSLIPRISFAFSVAKAESNPLLGEAVGSAKGGELRDRGAESFLTPWGEFELEGSDGACCDRPKRSSKDTLLSVDLQQSLQPKQRRHRTTMINPRPPRMPPMNGIRPSSSFSTVSTDM